MLLGLITVHASEAALSPCVAIRAPLFEHRTFLEPMGGERFLERSILNKSRSGPTAHPMLNPNSSLQLQTEAMDCSLKPRSRVSLPAKRQNHSRQVLGHFLKICLVSCKEPRLANPVSGLVLGTAAMTLCQNERKRKEETREGGKRLFWAPSLRVCHLQG